MEVEQSRARVVDDRTAVLTAYLSQTRRCATVATVLAGSGGCVLRGTVTTRVLDPPKQAFRLVRPHSAYRRMNLFW
jgi:hypothetical protein